MGITLKSSNIQRIAKEPISLEAPSEEEDSSLGDLSLIQMHLTLMIIDARNG